MYRIFLTTLAFLMLGATAQAERIVKEFNVKPGKKLYADIEVGGDLTITGWEKNIAQITVTMSGRDCGDIDMSMEERSGNVYINAESNFGDWDSDCSVDFDILLPEKFDLDVESVGGDFSITNITGQLEGKTKGGDMEFVRLGGNVHFVTMGGEIDLRKSEVDGLVKTMGGTVTIRDVVGDVKGKTMGGNVYYKNVTSSDGGTIETSTMGGNIDIHSKTQSVSAKTMGGNVDASGMEVKASSMGGNIDVREALEGADVHTMGGDINVKTAFKYVKAKTMGGDIQIESIDGWVKATTMGGDIHINMVGDQSVGDHHMDLTSFGGDVTITVPDDMGIEFDLELGYTKSSRGRYEIKSDFKIDLEETDEWERSFMFGERKKYIYGTGKAGDGKHLMKIKTTNGDITIRKG